MPESVDVENDRNILSPDKDPDDLNGIADGQEGGAIPELLAAAVECYDSTSEVRALVEGDVILMMTMVSSSGRGIRKVLDVEHRYARNLQTFYL